VDGGFGFDCTVPYVQTYPTNTGTGQQWIWNGSTFKNIGASAAGSCAGGGSPVFLIENVDATGTENTTGDTFATAASGSGWTIKNNRTGHFLGVVGGVLMFSTTSFVWNVM
jgi:hypothetical protein